MSVKKDQKMSLKKCPEMRLHDDRYKYAFVDNWLQKISLLFNPRTTYIG